MCRLNGLYHKLSDSTPGSSPGAFSLCSVKLKFIVLDHGDVITQPHRELHRFIEEQAGGAYRTAFRYTMDDWEAIYVRDDVATRQLKREVPRIIKRARESQSLLQEETYSALGELQATTEVHTDGVILHFHEAPEEGTVVSLDKEAARQLSDFLSGCTKILTSQPPGSDDSSATPD